MLLPNLSSVADPAIEDRKAGGAYYKARNINGLVDFDPGDYNIWENQQLFGTRLFVFIILLVQLITSSTSMMEMMQCMELDLSWEV